MDLVEYKQIKEKSFRRHPWEQTRLQFLLYLLNRLPHKNNFADTGSGDGYLASGVANRYPEARVTAIDINYTDELLEELNTTKPPNLSFTRDLHDIPDNETAGAIILMDVLEHIEKPEQLLKDLLSLKAVDNETRLIITVPAFQQLFSIHDKNLGHYRRYNLKQLEQLLSPLSLRMENSGYFFNGLLPVRYLQKQFEKNKPMQGKDSIHNWKGGPFITWILRTGFWIEFKITWYLARLGIKIPGLTCYCICRYAP
jgi:Methyltransferase domain